MHATDTANSTDPTLFFGRLFREFLPDYLHLVQSDFCDELLFDQATFPSLPPGLPECSVLGITVAVVPTRRPGERISVLILVESHPSPQAATARRVAPAVFHLLSLLEGQPVLLAILYLRGGRPGINLESTTICRACGLEVLRLFYTAFGLEKTKAEYYLERPEPLAWALSALMRPTRRSRAEHRLACLERIAAAELEEHRRLLLTRCVEEWAPLASDDAGDVAPTTA